VREQLKISASIWGRGHPIALVGAKARMPLPSGLSKISGKIRARLHFISIIAWGCADGIAGSHRK
jgi:hypothetical protein